MMVGWDWPVRKDTLSWAWEDWAWDEAHDCWDWPGS